MTTETKTLRIRRATPLDAVNLFKLLVDDEKRTGTGEAFDEAARVAHILTVIATGYVTVAVRAGRIVGSIGFVPGAPSYALEQVLVGEWFVLLPSFHGTKVGAKLLSGLLRFADFHKLGVFMVHSATNEALTKACSEAGFVETGKVFTRSKPVVDSSEHPESPTAPDG